MQRIGAVDLEVNLVVNSPDEIVFRVRKVVPNLSNFAIMLGSPFNDRNRELGILRVGLTKNDNSLIGSSFDVRIDEIMQGRGHIPPSIVVKGDSPGYEATFTSEEWQYIVDRLLVMTMRADEPEQPTS